jgi:FkbM family methyltransferase
MTEVQTILSALDRFEATRGREAVLVDIGANVGMFTIVAAAFGYRVIAFEAMPDNVRAIRETLCWNPHLADRVALFPYGLGATRATCRIISADENIADGHVVCDEKELVAYGDEYAQRGKVEIVRLDEILGGVEVPVVKIDVEGYEPHVLKGSGAFYNIKGKQ